MAFIANMDCCRQTLYAIPETDCSRQTLCGRKTSRKTTEWTAIARSCRRNTNRISTDELLQTEFVVRRAQGGRLLMGCYR